MENLNYLNDWKETGGNFAARGSAQSYWGAKHMGMAASGACGSACGAGGGKPSPPSPACGAGDDKPSPKPSACGAGDK